MRPQTDFIDTDVEIFKYEDGFEQIALRLGDYFSLPEGIGLPHDNPSGRDTVYWSNEALNLAADYYKNDFLQLNYKRREPHLQFSKQP